VGGVPGLPGALVTWLVRIVSDTFRGEAVGYVGPFDDHDDAAGWVAEAEDNAAGDDLIAATVHELHAP
jgi:hypothetical protein